MIPRDAPDFLPTDFAFAHDYAFFLHDCLASLVVEGERNDVFTTKFEVDPDSGAKNPEDFSHIFDWFEHHGRGDLLSEVLLKALFPALLSDFCHFLYESLCCSKKGKLTVAFALLRKPLLENLFYMEWLLAEPGDFLETFYNGESIDLSFGRVGSDPERVKAIVTAALARSPSRDELDASHLYELRFDRSFPGFYGKCNQATHLITTKGPIATFRQNFNFVFSNDEDRTHQWRMLYESLPMLLYYANAVAESLFSVMVEGEVCGQDRLALQRQVGFLAWASDVADWQDGMYGKGIYDGADFRCPHCSDDWKPSGTELKKVFYERKVRCPACRRRIGLDDLLNMDGG